MLYKLGKKCFKFVIDALHFTQVSLVFFTFFMILYWILFLANVPFVVGLTPFFDGIKDIVHLFYNRIVVVDAVSIDFSFVIAAFIILLAVWGLKFVVAQVEYFEKWFDTLHNNMKKQSEAVFNKGLEIKYKGMEKKNKHFLVLIKVTMINLQKDSFFTHEKGEDPTDKQKQAIIELNNNLSKVLQFQKMLTDGSILLFFEKFDEIDKTLIKIEHIFEHLKTKYKLQKWDFINTSAIDILNDKKDITTKYNTLKTLVKLNLRNEIACLPTFVQRYNLMSNQKYYTEGKGVYKIDEETEVFCIKNRAKHIKNL